MPKSQELLFLASEFERAGRRARWTWFCFQIETKKDMEGGDQANVRSTYATLRLTHPNLPVELRDFQVVGWTLDCSS